MVQSTGTATGPDSVQPLKPPRPVRVETGDAICPTAITLRRARLNVGATQDRWRIDDGWWHDKPISRIYYQVVLEDGRSMTIFHDLVTGKWYEQGYA